MITNLSIELVLQDFLISLKKLAIQRANISGHKELAEIFDLKTVRALGMSLSFKILKKSIQQLIMRYC